MMLLDIVEALGYLEGSVHKTSVARGRATRQCHQSIVHVS